MSLFFKRYCVIGWDGKEHRLTARKLYERVMDDSKSDYDWIASATELVRVCNRIDFPGKYAQEIKMAILNCFANLETRREIASRSKTTDANAVYFCYNSLDGTDERVIAVKKKYLTAVIEGITKYHFGSLEFNHYGPAYFKICEEWKKAKFKEYNSMGKIDFEKLRKALDDDFDKTMKTAEAEGVFKEEDEKREKEMRGFWSSLDFNKL